MLQAMQRNSCNWPLQLRSPYWEYGHRWTSCLAKHQTHCTQLYRSSRKISIFVNKKEGTEHFHAPKPVFLSVYTWNLELGRSLHFHDHHLQLKYHGFIKPWCDLTACGTNGNSSSPTVTMTELELYLDKLQHNRAANNNNNNHQNSDTATAAVVSFVSASPSYQDPKFFNVKRQWNKTTEAEATTITTFPKSSVYLSYLNQKNISWR